MLTEAQIAQFHDRGFLVVEDLVDPATLAALHAEYAARMDQLYASWQAQGLVPKMPADAGFWDKLSACIQGGFDWYQPFDISLPHDGITRETPMHTGPAVFDLLTHPRILDLAEALIGPELTSNPIQHTRIKPPQDRLDSGEGRAHVSQTDWHQDRGVGLAEADETEMITVWIAITDATVENGCLQVVPDAGSEMYPHCPRGQMGLADGFVDYTRAQPVPVRAGGAVILHPLTPHSSLPNTTDGYRWSFDMRYNVTGQPTGRSQFPEFVARSRINPSAELRDWKAWAKSWTDAKHHLAHAPHMPQHRWSGDAPYCA